jgi:mannose-6-phosphate isomerase
MLVPITNDPRPYAWGSREAIADLLGRAPSGRPEAELWLGAHPGSPARICYPDLAGGHRDLAALVRAEPLATLGPRLADDGRLPFLLKVLAAQSPLSLQAHPTRAQAAEGFAREDRAGVPVGDAVRSYRDRGHKPEMILALSETFDALCGFRPLDEARHVLDRLRQLSADDVEPRPDLIDLLGRRLGGPGGLRDAVAWLLGGAVEVAELVAHVAHLARVDTDDALLADALATAAELSTSFPADPGVVAALLVRRVRLRRGEALYLPPGSIHAYVRGLGIELMAASDNVLRGGLTSKHVDVPELLEVLDFGPLPVPHLAARRCAPGVRVFHPDAVEFALVHAVLAGKRIELPVADPAIVLVTRGRCEVSGRSGTLGLRRGGALFVSPDEERLVLRGDAELLVATTGGRSLDVTAVPDQAARVPLEAR